VTCSRVGMAVAGGSLRSQKHNDAETAFDGKGSAHLSRCHAKNDVANGGAKDAAVMLGRFLDERQIELVGGGREGRASLACIGELPQDRFQPRSIFGRGVGGQSGSRFDHRNLRLIRAALDPGSRRSDKSNM